MGRKSSPSRYVHGTFVSSFNNFNLRIYKAFGCNSKVYECWISLWPSKPTLACVLAKGALHNYMTILNILFLSVKWENGHFTGQLWGLHKTTHLKCVVQNKHVTNVCPFSLSNFQSYVCLEMLHLALMHEGGQATGNIPKQFLTHMNWRPCLFCILYDFA